MALNTETVLQGEWSAAADLPFFAGHFPGRPILPAVATLDFCIGFLKERLNRPELKIAAVQSAKFASPIAPGTRVTTVCTQLSESGWRFLLKEKASGRALAELTITLA